MNTVDFIKEKVPVFRDFPVPRLKELVDGSQTASFEANEAIAHSGDEAAHFGVVLSGKVAATVGGNGGPRQSLGELKAGDTFGEASLMTGNPFLADLIAESHCEV